MSKRFDRSADSLLLFWLTTKRYSAAQQKQRKVRQPRRSEWFLPEKGKEKNKWLKLHCSSLEKKNNALHCKVLEKNVEKFTRFYNILLTCVHEDMKGKGKV